jgi:class 3 adenylate cyclase/tetratricopeptide (TPR) repeat protein
MSESPDAEASLPSAGRRRYLTILFSDLSDSTQLAAGMEAEHYAELLRALRDGYEAIVPRHGGVVVRIQGDGLLAIFGYPEPREGDAVRATEAALELHGMARGLRAAAGATPPQHMALHSGIHSGQVLLLEGDLVIGRFELLGNAPNIAARLSDLAARDEILVSEETLGPESHFFDISPRRYLHLKGRADPVAVHLVRGRAAIHTRFQAGVLRGLVPLVGRRTERESLERKLGEVVSGSTVHLALVGPAGLGKTRLAEEFLRLAASRDCQVHRGYCEDDLSAEPLQPFLQMLRSLFGLHHGLSVGDAAAAVNAFLQDIDAALLAHVPALQGALSLSGETGADKHSPAPGELVAALCALFAALVARKPLVLFIDDWQWADDASAQVLRAIRGTLGQRVFVLLATRGIDVGSSTMEGLERLALEPLDEHEANQAIGHLLPRSDPFVMAEIRRYAGGNPLFIEELCHCAAHDDMDSHMVRLHGSAAWLSVLIEARLARLPDVQADVARVAAVIGNVVPAWLLEKLTGRGADDALVLGLAQHDFLFPGETSQTLRFKHGITRDVIYASLGLHQRRAMHLRIAEALRQHASAGGQDEALESLAYHFDASGRAEEAAHYAEQAGDKARAASALDRAKAQYRAALSALDKLEPSIQYYRRWAAISQKLGLVCVFDAARTDLPVFRRAVALALESDDTKALARAQYWLGYINYSLGESRAAIHHCERARQAAQDAGDNPLAVQIVATLGQARTAAADYDRALSLLDEAIAIKRQHRSGSKPSVGFAYTLVCRAWILGDRGRFDQAHACLDEAQDAVLGVTHEIGASVHGWRSALLLWQGRWDAARQAGEDSARIAEQTHSVFQFCMGRAMAAYACWMAQRQPDALQALIDATSWLTPLEGGLFISFNHGWLADALASVDRVDEARRHAALALQRARKRDLIGVAMAYRALAQLAADRNDAARVQRYLGLAKRTAGMRQSPHEIAVTQLCEARIRLGQGEHREAGALLDRAMSAFEAMAMDWHLAQAAELRQRV